MVRRKRPPPTFSPPTRIVSAKAQRARVAKIRKARAEAGAKRIANIKAPRIAVSDVGETMRRILERESGVDWSVAEFKPRRYWQRRIELSTDSRRVSYDQILEWRFAIVQNKTIARALGGRTVSVMVRVKDPNRRGSLWFTAAAAGDYDRAMDELASKLEAWAESYGDGSTSGDEVGDDFTRVRQIVILYGKEDSAQRRATLARRLERKGKDRKPPRRPKR